MNATLGQARKILDLIDESGADTRQLQNILPYFSDLLRANTDVMNREDFRKACGLMPVEKERRFGNYLRLLKSGLVLDAANGTEILATATEMFQAGIDSDFRNWKADEPGQATAETKVSVYEITKDANFAQMFGLNSNPEKFCLTQAQIKGFVKKHRKWLRTDGYATFFPFKSHGHFFVADVRVYFDDRLNVSVNRFEDSLVWLAEDRRRVVIPQLV